MRLTLTRRDLCKGAIAATSALPLRSGQSERFKLGIVTDELTGKLEDALSFITSYHLGWCELREILGKNIMNLSVDELNRARKLVDNAVLKVSDIASPIFKWNLPQMPAKEAEKRDVFNASFTEDDRDRLLEESFRLARRFGTRKVRVFRYWRIDEPEKAYKFVREGLEKAARLAMKNDVVLVLENEHTCNVGTGREL